jgi:methionyl-tRNA formyltransferase
MPPLRIVFAGTPEFAVPALQALQDAGHLIVAVYTQPDRPAGRGREVASSAVKQRALALGLVVEQPPTLKAPEAQQRLADYAPDLMVVVAYGLILPQAVLDIPRLGCLNIHGSLLPRWRGAAPIQRAVLAGDTRTGISIMLMDAGLDTGPELLRRELSIGSRETGGELQDRLAPLGAEAIVAAVQGWVAGSIRPTPQPAAGATYAAKIRKDEARIDWSKSAAAIDRQVRAFNPRPIAETQLCDGQVRIWEARPVTAEFAAQPGALPGTLVPAAAGRIVVATGDGLLELLTMQFPGRKPLKARDILNSGPLGGERFGEVKS